MEQKMKEKVLNLVDYLYEIGLTQDRILGVINPLKTVVQTEQLTEWIQKNKITDPNIMRKQAKIISQN